MMNEQLAIWHPTFFNNEKPGTESGSESHERQQNTTGRADGKPAIKVAPRI